MIRRSCGTIFGIEFHIEQAEPLCGLCSRRLAAAHLEAERFTPVPPRKGIRV